MLFYCSGAHFNESIQLASHALIHISNILLYIDVIDCINFWWEWQKWKKNPSIEKWVARMCMKVQTNSGSDVKCRKKKGWKWRWKWISVMKFTITGDTPIHAEWNFPGDGTKKTNKQTKNTTNQRATPIELCEFYYVFHIGWCMNEAGTRRKAQRGNTREKNNNNLSRKMLTNVS